MLASSSLESLSLQVSYINQCLGIGDALEQGCPPDSFT